MEEHFDRFEATNGKYVRTGRPPTNYVILDIKLHGFEPSRLPDKYAHLSDKVYTYCKERNWLFHGQNQINDRVSSLLPFFPKITDHDEHELEAKVKVSTKHESKIKSKPKPKPKTKKDKDKAEANVKRK
jgi:hypothetical protein